MTKSARNRFNSLPRSILAWIQSTPDATRHLRQWYRHWGSFHDGVEAMAYVSRSGVLPAGHKQTIDEWTQAGDPVNWSYCAELLNRFAKRNVP